MIIEREYIHTAVYEFEDHDEKFSGHVIATSKTEVLEYAENLYPDADYIHIK
jgi:hypothetical protein